MFYDLIEDPTLITDMEPEEIAALILEYLNLPTTTPYQQNLTNFLSQNVYASHYEIQQALTEGWMWLVHQGFLAPKPAQPSSTSRAAAELTQRERKLLS